MDAFRSVVMRRRSLAVVALLPLLLPANMCYCGTIVGAPLADEVRTESTQSHRTHHHSHSRHSHSEESPAAPNLPPADGHDHEHHCPCICAGLPAHAPTAHSYFDAGSFAQFSVLADSHLDAVVAAARFGDNQASPFATDPPRYLMLRTLRN